MFVPSLVEDPCVELLTSFATCFADLQQNGSCGEAGKLQEAWRSVSA